MLQLQIHEGDSSEQGDCPDCGGKTRTIWGYVYRDEEAYCAYYAAWTAGHVERGIQLLLSIGLWGDGTNGTMRRSVGLECNVNAGQPGCAVVDANNLPWANEDLLGKPLSREEVLTDPIKDEAFAIVDRILADDARVRDFLYGAATAT